jgi:hypothetical protein
MAPPLGEMTSQLISTAPPLIFTQAGMREAMTASAARGSLMKRAPAGRRGGAEKSRVGMGASRVKLRAGTLAVTSAFSSMEVNA